MHDLTKMTLASGLFLLATSVFAQEMQKKRRARLEWHR